MNRAEARSQKRKEVIEAIILRQEPVHLVARIYHLPQRTLFDWLSRYRSGGWDALKEGARSGRKRKLSADDMKWLIMLRGVGRFLEGLESWAKCILIVAGWCWSLPVSP